MMKTSRPSAVSALQVVLVGWIVAVVLFAWFCMPGSFAEAIP